MPHVWDMESGTQTIWRVYQYGSELLQLTFSRVHNANPQWGSSLCTLENIQTVQELLLPSLCLPFDMLVLMVTHRPLCLEQHWRQGRLSIRGVRRCFWMGGLTVWVAQPTYRRVWGRLLGNIFYVYALKSILVHSETKLISLIGTILKTIRVNSNWGCVALFWNMGGYSPPSPPASYASAHMLTKCTTWKYYLWPDLRKPTTL